MRLLMVKGPLNLVRATRMLRWQNYANQHLEHTLLVTDTGVEVLTAANENSPGGPIPMPAVVDGTEKVKGSPKS